LLSKWPIRNKMLLGLALLLVIVGTLSAGSIHGLYAYRSLVKSLGRRTAELPLANDFSQSVSNLRATLPGDFYTRREVWSPNGVTPVGLELARGDFHDKLHAVEDRLDRYRIRLVENDVHLGRLGDSRREWDTVRKIEATVRRITNTNRDESWILNANKVDGMNDDLERLQILAAQLPSYLHDNLRNVADEASGQYRTLIVLTWITSVAVTVMLVLFVDMFYRWIFRPLRVLIKGSRRVATGQFNYRIHLDSNDEMAELAHAMNEMTHRFEVIRDDLDRQVQERTREVVRSEQLASVGFLAAGVAHEINNPLASIAMCAESLESRLEELPQADEATQRIVRDYLRMIQTEAFRCKEITGNLLDFSRLGDVERHNTDLRELVKEVVDMLGHLGKYNGKHIELTSGEPVVAPVNAQEIKQVVLNLLTNGLDSVDPGGAVRIEICRRGGEAEVDFVDNGCGMTSEVLTHLFEPFFTRRRGGQGTGLGLSITYRIVADHGGTIEAESAGPGAGSRFRVRLPLAASEKETTHRYQAA